MGLRRSAHVAIAAAILIVAIGVPLQAGQQVPSGGWAATGEMSQPRWSAAAALLPDGRLLITGGYDGTGQLATADLLLEAIRTVTEGKYWIGDERAVELVDTFRELMADAGSGSFGLTRRQLKIVAMVAAGRTNRKIAESLSLSEDTVKHHLTVIFDKVGVSSRLELAQFAAQHRLRDSA